MIVGQRTVQDHTALRELAAQCQPFLGLPDALWALAEDAVGSRLEKWPDLPRTTWTQGRIFGVMGELRWRTYGPHVRAVIVTDWDGQPAQIAELGFSDATTLDLQPDRKTVALWRADRYRQATVWRYVDANGIAQFVRYADVQLQQGED